jgi:hypothetical protein
MKKAKAVRKLEISKETLRQLSNPDLDRVAAGGWSDDSICPTVNTDTSCRCPV